MIVTFIGRKLHSSGKMCVLSHEVPDGIPMDEVDGILYRHYQDVHYVRFCTPKEYRAELAATHGQYFAEHTLRHVIQPASLERS